MGSPYLGLIGEELVSEEEIEERSVVREETEEKSTGERGDIGDVCW